jgi:predicted lipoprotein with Yx(FWY)xxD motif
MDASPTASMMNLGMSGIENSNEDVYDVHMTYFSDVNEYVLEYEGACEGEGAVRANNWLDDDDLVSLGSQVDNMDQTSPCGVNVAYHYNDATDTWMAATLDSTGIDYNHNGLEAAQRDWATTTHFNSAMAQWSSVYDMPSALTSVNDITNGKFGPHTFGAASTDYAVLSASNAEGNYLTTADGMTLYIYWGDDDGQTCGAACQQAWPAFYGGVGMIVDPSLDNDDFGTITNTEGDSQTTFQGWPLYTYAADAFPTDMNGDGQTDSGGTRYAAGTGYETGPTDACVSELNGGAPYAWSGTLCAGSYTLSMWDRWGDGWNGNEFVITDSSGAQLWSATIYGSSGTDTFSLDANPPVTISCGGGAWHLG